MTQPFLLNNPTTWTQFLLPIAGAIIALVLGWIFARLAYTGVRRWLPRVGDGPMTTVAPFLAQAVRYAVLIVAVITALSFVGVPSASILTVVGTASLAIALALQNSLSNVAAGIMLAWMRPIAVGEYITGDGVEGEVVEIGLFGTRLRSTSGLFIFTNNNRLWNGAITNHSREPRRRIDIKVTLPDTADIDRVRTLLVEVGEADARVLRDPAPVTFVDSFGTDTVTLQIRVWVRTPDYRFTLRDLTEQVKLAVNRMLAAGGTGATAAIQQDQDPHLAQMGGEKSDPGNTG
jgi:small conductance mechanosensitive channel